MYAAKRRRSVAKGDLNNDLKKSSSAFNTTSPAVLILTFLSVAGYWRQVPNVPEAVKAFVDVQRASPGFAPPPPTLPRRVPLDIKGPVDLACRAAKQAWLIEAQRTA